MLSSDGIYLAIGIHNLSSICKTLYTTVSNPAVFETRQNCTTYCLLSSESSARATHFLEGGSGFDSLCWATNWVYKNNALRTKSSKEFELVRMDVVTIS